MIASKTVFLSQEVVEAVEGRCLQQGSKARAYAGVSTDSRDELEGRLFIALSGANFDAHDFLGQAADAGAQALLVSEAGTQAGWRTQPLAPKDRCYCCT